MRLPSRPGHTLTALRHRLGRRGAFLLFLSLLDWTYGATLIADKLNPLLQYNTHLPLTAWGWLWVLTGVTCGVFAFTKGDEVGFGVAAFMKTAWSGLNLDLWIQLGYRRGLTSAIIWLGFTIVVILIAFWPEPPPAGRPE